jgi:2-iminobutanoate/2-iminopropanoate deaminase
VEEGERNMTLIIQHVPVSGDPSQGIDALKKQAASVAYSDCVRVDLPDHSLLYISGKMGAKDGVLAGRTMVEQARQVMENLKAVLVKQGGTLENIVRLRIYVTQIDSASIRDVHAVRAEYFGSGKFPASTLVQVNGLVRDGGLIEMEADVVLPPRG